MSIHCPLQIRPITGRVVAPLDRLVMASCHASQNSLGRLCDGAEAGVFDSGETVGGNQNTGWMDVMTGITAHRRQDGEHLVFVEEDYKAKVLLYRWKP